MELKGKRWENYSTPQLDCRRKDEYWKQYPEDLILQTFSIGKLLEVGMQMKENAKLNNENIYEVPIFIEKDNQIYTLNGFSIGTEYNTLMLNESNRMVYTAPDSKPEKGEFWSSRGCGLGRYGKDCSGFVKSKLAGERLGRLVRYILDKDETESWLDYRENEPSHIQFKFSDNEFDVEKLDKMTTENKYIITEQILRNCKR